MPRWKWTSYEERFLAKIEKASNGCWVWIAGRRQGYGRIAFRGRLASAHRVSWTLFRGEIPEGMKLLHSCDNPSCVNPDHLRPGTQAENVRDRDAKCRGNWRRGQDHGRAKLKNQDIAAIRSLQGKLSHLKIGLKFGVSESTIRRIINRENWTDVS